MVIDMVSDVIIKFEKRKNGNTNSPHHNKIVFTTLDEYHYFFKTYLSLKIDGFEISDKV